MANIIIPCVHVNHKDFIKLAQDANVDKNTLELITHDYRKESGDLNGFPPLSYVQEKLGATTYEEASNDVIEVWNKKYTQALTFSSKGEAAAKYQELLKIFPKSAVVEYYDNAGNPTIKVKEPVNTKALMEEMQSIKEKAIANGTFMKAPNGKSSNLNEKQWLQVRTKSFKDWFGDWENDPKNASKVVDENGEPLVVYHGTPDVITDFNYKDSREWNPGFFFTSDKEYAQDIANKKGGNIIMPIFLNIKNPITTDTPLVSKSIEGIYILEGDRNSDGIIGHDLKTGEFKNSNGTEYLVSKPNQIKSAIDNVGTFSNTEDNIYYEHEFRNLQTQRQDLKLNEIAKTTKNKKALSLNDIYSLFEKTEYKEILDALIKKKKLPLNLSFKLVYPIDSFHNAQTVRDSFHKKRAYYDAKTHTVYVNMESLFNDGDSTSVLMHEIMHAATLDRILNNKTARKEFENILKQYREARPDEVLYTNERVEIEEFIADIWSNKKVIEDLKTIKDNRQKDKSLWQKIIDAFLQMFEDVNEDSLMVTASIELSKLLQDSLDNNNIIEDRTFFEQEASIQMAQDVVAPGTIITPIEKKKDIEGNARKEGSKVLLKDAIKETEKYFMKIGSGKEYRDYLETTYGYGDVVFEDNILKYYAKDGEYVVFMGSQEDMDAFMEYQNRIDPSVPILRKKIIESSNKALTSYEIEKKINEEKTLAKNNDFSKHLDNLLNSDIITASEVSSLAVDMIYSISNLITEIQDNPEKIKEYFPNSNISPEEISSSDRLGIYNKIGISNIIEYQKKQFLSAAQKSKDAFKVIKKARLLNNNFNALMQIGATTFTDLEGFALNVTNSAVAELIQESTNEDADNFNASNNIDETKEVTGNLQEHWQVEFRTLDIMTSMSVKVKQEISKCEQKDKDGNVVLNEFGIPKRIEARVVTGSILQWTQGSVTLSDMIGKLEEKKKDNPWIEPILNKLRDPNEVEFSTQFFNVFDKHFQKYGIGKNRENVMASMPVNEKLALTDVTNSILARYAIKEHPLFTSSNEINKTSLEKLKESVQSLNELFTKVTNKQAPITNATDILKDIFDIIGFEFEPDDIKKALTPSVLKSTKEALSYVITALNNQYVQQEEDKKKGSNNYTNYAPFTFGAANAILTNMKNALEPFANILEPQQISSFFDSGKMYQSYVIPSYMTKLMQKFRNPDKTKFAEFMGKEYQNYGFFYNKTNGQYRTPWLRILNSNSDARGIIDHKVQLNYDGKNYMRNMNDSQYALSAIMEYFIDKTYVGTKNTPSVAWFRIPMLSNKPSAEYVKFYAEKDMTSEDGIERYKKNLLLNHFLPIFFQELDRIATVRQREAKGINKKNPAFIKSFDTNGKVFNFLSYMNNYIDGNVGNMINESRNQGGDKRLSSLIGQYIKGELTGNNEALAELQDLAYKAIGNYMTQKASAVIEKWKNLGIMEAAKKIEGINKTSNELLEKDLENFIWNDHAASINIMQMTVTDIAYYKDAEDLQKRLAQIHAPGIRANYEVTAYKLNDEFKYCLKDGKVSDGTFRTMLLTDFDSFISNIKENVSIIYDRKIEAETNKDKKRLLQALKNKLVGYTDEKGEHHNGAFDEINVADAQGYSGPTSYRKKALMFGKWTKESEQWYRDYMDYIQNPEKHKDFLLKYMELGYQPLKPFVYSQVSQDSGLDANSVMPVLKVPVQFKNSEYLLFMAEALMAGEDTGKPNILKAIHDIMEDSAYTGRRRDAKGNIIEVGTYNGKGIDTIQFESTCKSGLRGKVSVNEFLNDSANGYRNAFEKLQKSIWGKVNAQTGELEITDTYDPYCVYELPMEDYAIQQEVPEHFKNHEQAHGSQLRMITPSDLEFFKNPELEKYDSTKGSEENKVYYTYKDTDGKEVKTNATQFREDYEKTIAEKIDRSLQELKEEFHLGENASASRKDINKTLSLILQKEILNSPRYGIDLFQACSLDENGEFRIPKGDPIQAKRIEQLINSMIKNRINKQTIPGGPVVQVSNFGTSRELNIVFNGKDGKPLKTRKEFKGTDEEFKAYLKENQAGISHFEVFAPVYDDALYQFMDENGTIDIEAIEATNPELLEMIGYRIPTEDKYSSAPLKIVGFLPKWAGEGIMLPNDITLLTGSDFDVDKEYLMRKSFRIKQSVSNKKAREKLLEEALKSIENSSKLSEEQKKNVSEIATKDIDNFFDLLGNSDLMIATKVYPKIARNYRKIAFKSEVASDIAALDNKIVDMTLSVLRNETTADKMLNPGGFDEQKVMGYAVEAFKSQATDKSGKVMTMNELIALGEEDINALKKLCYKNKNLMFIDTQVEFYKQNNAAGALIGQMAVHKVAHATLESNGYRLNFAKITRMNADQLRSYSIGDYKFGTVLELDAKYDTKGNLIGKTLGSLVAAAADAVKDPIFNLINVNSQTSTILNAMIRIGMPWKTASMFIASDIISKVLEKYNRNSLSSYSSIDSIIDSFFKEFKKETSIDLLAENVDSPLFYEGITEEDLEKALIQQNYRNDSLLTDDEDTNKRNAKILLAYKRLSATSTVVKKPTFCTRFNSISSAVGPLIIDNVITKHKLNMFDLDDSKTLMVPNSNGGFAPVTALDVFSKHPILKGFVQTLEIADQLFKDMPVASRDFLAQLNTINELANNEEAVEIFYNDRKLLGQFSDFYQSYILTRTGFVNSKDLSKFAFDFPSDFMKEKAKPEYKDNLLMQSIKIDISKRTQIPVLKCDIVGMNATEKEKLSVAWADLHKKNPELSKKLFLYNFFRTGIGFSPKTFMSLMPTYVKENLSFTRNDGNGNMETVSYKDLFDSYHNTDAPYLMDQFIRNNMFNNKLVPIIDSKEASYNKDSNALSTAFLSPTGFIKMKVDKEYKLFQFEKQGSESLMIYKEVSPLGLNGEFLEMSQDYIENGITNKVLEQQQESAISATSGEETVIEVLESDDNIHSNDIETLSPIGEEAVTLEPGSLVKVVTESEKTAFDKAYELFQKTGSIVTQDKLREIATDDATFKKYWNHIKEVLNRNDIHITDTDFNTIKNKFKGIC